MLTITERLDRLTAALTAAQLQKSDYGPSGPAKGKGGGGGGKGRKVASKAGEKRYGLPIGTPLGQTKSRLKGNSTAEQRYDRFMQANTPADQRKAASWMSNEELAKTAEVVFSAGKGNERVESARMMLVKELAERGIDPHKHGYDGGHVPLNPNPKEDPVAKKVRLDQSKAERTARVTQSQVDRAAKKLEQAAKLAAKEKEKAEAKARAATPPPEASREFWDRQRRQSTRV